MHSLPRCFLIGITLAAATASGAGIQMTTVNVNPSGTSRAETLIEGDRFKVSYSEAPPGMPAGAYIVGTEKDRMYFVVPSRSVYARFDAKEFSSMQQKQAGPDGGEPAPGSMTRTVEDFQFKKELDEAGPAMFGLSTRHYRYTLGYKEVMKMTGMPMAMTNKVTETHEFWATTELNDAVAFKMLSGDASAADSDATDKDKVAEANRLMEAHGMRMKSITTTKSVRGGLGGMAKMMGGGKGETTTTKVEVVAFARVDPPADAFTLPDGYQETDLMGLFAGGRSKMPDLNSPPNQKAKPPSNMPDLNSTP